MLAVFENSIRLAFILTNKSSAQNIDWFFCINTADISGEKGINSTLSIHLFTFSELYQNSPVMRGISQNNLLGVIPKLTPTYSIKFDFKPNTFQNDWTTILQLTATNKDHDSTIGNRLPAVFLHGVERGKKVSLSQ